MLPNANAHLKIKRFVRSTMVDLSHIGLKIVLRWRLVNGEMLWRRDKKLPIGPEIFTPRLGRE